MKTATIQIGNSDDKLSQYEWSQFVADVKKQIEYAASTVHFSGGSETSTPWQNYCFVFNVEPSQLTRLCDVLEEIRKKYKQDSLALTCGITEFI